MLHLQHTTVSGYMSPIKQPYLSILPQVWHPAESVVGTDSIQTGLQQSFVMAGSAQYGVTKKRLRC